MPDQDNAGLDNRVRDLEQRSREQDKGDRDRDIEFATMKEWMRSISEQMKTFVTKSEFGPVKMIAYGLAGTVMASVLTAVVAKVIVK